jgi:hypothetical protein
MGCRRGRSMRACSWLGLAIARRLGPLPRDRARCSDACAAEHLAGILAESPACWSASGRVEAIPEASNRSSPSPAYTYIDHSPPRSWPTTRRAPRSVTAKSRRPLVRAPASERECGISLSEGLRSASGRAAAVHKTARPWSISGPRDIASRPRDRRSLFGCSRRATHHRSTSPREGGAVFVSASDGGWHER